MGQSLFKIRKTTDFNLVKQLNDVICPSDPLKIKEDTHCWIVWVKGDAVGYCTVDILKGGIAFLSRAGLLEEARGFNLQKRLIDVRERFAKKIGCNRIITYTKIYNIASSANLQKKGYFLYIPAYQYADEDCLYWLKNLHKLD